MNREQSMIETLREGNRELRARIIELETEVARLQEAARWIPVGERLPQSWDDVLVSDGKTVCLGYWNFREWDATFGRLPFEVVYWRPLPEPPEGGEG